MYTPNENQEPLSSEDHDESLTNAISSIMENRTIEIEINTLKEDARTCHSLRKSKDFDEYYLDENYNAEESIEFCLKKIKNGEITKFSISNLHLSTFFPKSLEEKESTLIILSEIYIAIAQAALKENSIRQAWGAACCARNYLGHFLGMRDDLLHKKYERAKSGGYAKAKNANLAKEMMIDLVRQKRPTKGWKSPTSAVEGIIDTALDLIKKEKLRLPINRDDLTQYLINLLIENKDAIEATKPLN